MGKTMRIAAACLLLATLAVISAVPTETDHSVLGETDAVADKKDANSKDALQAKLKKLQHTFDRIKKSCKANDVPKEEMDLGEGGEEATTAAQLQDKIKKMNKKIDKVADACMPGEETTQFGEE